MKSSKFKDIVARSLSVVGLESVARSTWRHARLFGLRYVCPMCGAHLNTFLPGGYKHKVLVDMSVIGGGHRSNLYCPRCRSTDRERLAYLYLKRRPYLLSKGTKLLHIAPEKNLRKWLQSMPGLEYVTADLDVKDPVDLHFDVTSVPLSDATFHAVICNHVLEHVPDDAKAMSELRRILKPGGWAILQTPISSSLTRTYEDFSITDPAKREQAFGQKDHVRIYAMDYVHRLERAGFNVELFHWRGEKGHFGGATNKFGLNEKERIIIASRSIHQQLPGGFD